MDEKHRELYAALGHPSALRPAPAIAGVAAFATGSGAHIAAPPPAVDDGVPLADEQMLHVLQEQLEDEPELTLAKLRGAWDHDLTMAEARAAIAEARSMLRSPQTAVAAVHAAEVHAAAAVVPPEFDFEGYAPNEIPLNIDSTQFQTKADAPRWALMTAAAVLGVVTRPKAPFPRHRHPDRPFVYERDAPGVKPIELALFSDFGTGLAHSRYIAKHLTTKDPAYDCVFHLGDVYYAGRQSEFDEYFINPLKGLVARSTLMLINANHEMFSKAYPFFGYITAKRHAHPQRQVQEGSYFAVRYGKQFQIVGIDTDYFGHGRFRDAELRSWLSRVLTEGRQANMTNILLVGNEPYTYGSKGTTALYDDLAFFFPGVDLMLWGNTHYCALFDKTDRMPVGSCIGHGGYPYLLDEYDLDKPRSAVAVAPAPARFAEQAPRYPRWTGLRQETGNNGWVDMRLRADGSIELVYRDWMKHDRCIVHLGRDATGRLAITDCVEF